MLTYDDDGDYIVSEDLPGWSSREAEEFDYWFSFRVTKEENFYEYAPREYYIAGISCLSNSYGDKAYRKYEDWFDALDKSWDSVKDLLNNE